MNDKIAKRLDKYLKVKGCIELRLYFIRSYLNQYTVSYLVRLLKDRVASPLNWDQFLKIVILVNKLLIEQQVDGNRIGEILAMMKVKNKKGDKFEEMIIKDLLVPYRLYLQKRCQVDLTDTDMDYDAKVYKLLNLINGCTSFSSVFFVLGRYYQQTIKYLPTLNRVIAQDLSIIYKCLTNQLNPPVSDSFLQDLGKVHQKMYIVFYNCYFCHQVAEYRPRWIKTDVQNPLMSTKAKTKKHGEVSTDKSFPRKEGLPTEQSTPQISQFQESRQMWQILGFNVDRSQEVEENMHEDKKENELNLQRLKLIQSMERIVDRIN